MMGGIPTDSEGHVLATEADSILSGLFAVGECACVSVHGANRLGCNSLIDLVVFGRRTGQSVVKHAKEKELPLLPQQAENTLLDKINRLLDSRGNEHVPALRSEMQCLMAEKCSVFRNDEGLQETLNEICKLQKRYLNVGLDNKSKIFNYDLQEAFELDNMLKTAEAIVFSALQRRESRGAHYRSDFPMRNDEEWLRHTLVSAVPEGLAVTYKPISVTRFSPQERRY